MGVMACNRTGCENVMCDRRSVTHGHICDECYNQLVNLGFDTNIQRFMESKKGDSYEKDPALAKVRFASEFPKGG